MIIISLHTECIFMKRVIFITGYTPASLCILKNWGNKQLSAKKCLLLKTEVQSSAPQHLGESWASLVDSRESKSSRKTQTFTCHLHMLIYTCMHTFTQEHPHTCKYAYTQYKYMQARNGAYSWWFVSSYSKWIPFPTVTSQALVFILSVTLTF